MSLDPARPRSARSCGHVAGRGQGACGDASTPRLPSAPHAGVHKLAQLAAIEPRRLEAVAQRHYPFGARALMQWGASRAP